MRAKHPRNLLFLNKNISQGGPRATSGPRPDPQAPEICQICQVEGRLFTQKQQYHRVKVCTSSSLPCPKFVCLSTHLRYIQPLLTVLSTALRCTWVLGDSVCWSPLRLMLHTLGLIFFPQTSRPFIKFKLFVTKKCQRIFPTQRTLPSANDEQHCEIIMIPLLVIKGD